MNEDKEEKLDAAYLPEKLKGLRNKAMFSVEQMALLSGVTVQSIRSYEAGLTSPNVKRLVKLANFFDVSLDYFCKKREISLCPLSKADHN